MNPLIVIDPGHGGNDSGAIGPTGKLEKDCNLTISKLIHQKLLDANFESRLTRHFDQYLSLTARANYANNCRADFFLSIHANAGGGFGFEAYTSPYTTDADPIATKLLNDYSIAFPTWTFRKDLIDGDPDKEAKFTVLTDTNTPAVLFETQFIDNYEGEKLLFDPSVQNKIATTLATTLTNHFTLSSIEPEPLNLNDKLNLTITTLTNLLNQIKQ